MASAATDLTGREHNADPYPFYARLRRESPVHKAMMPGGQAAWLVTRYDDVLSVLKDDRFAKDPLNALTPQEIGRQPWMPACAGAGRVRGRTVERGRAARHGVPAAGGRSRDDRQPDRQRRPGPGCRTAAGMGGHFCLGASLARMEARIAIGTLLRVIDRWRPAVAPRRLRWKRGLVLRGLEALPVTVDAWR